MYIQLINSATKWLQQDRDYILLLAVSLLICIGAVMVFSASVDFSVRKFGVPYAMALRQWTAISLGLMAFWVITYFPLQVWRRMRWFLYLLAVALLVLVLFPQFGAEVRGSRRWIKLPFFSLQVSEFMKLAFIIFMAGYIEKFAPAMRTDWTNSIKVLSVPLAVVLILLFLEPDAGAMVGIAFIVMGMMFFAGANIGGFAILLALVVAILGMVLYAEPYRVERIIDFTDPWREYLSGGYQVSHSLMAISQGSWFGTGLGGSVQKLGFLPDEYSDFVIAVYIEETGFFGLCILLLLYALILWRLFALCALSWRLNLLFAGSVALGLGLWLFFQVTVNIGTAFGLLPPKGLVLPLMSYGGTNVLMMCVIFGIVARADIEVRRVWLSKQQETAE